MRLQSLHIERFGHFVGAKLELPPSGLTLVHGGNEAGKTTLLEAIRWLLFGGKDNRHAFAFDPQLLAVSARVEMGEPASVLDIRRTRGRGAGLKGTVRTGDEVDEEWIRQKWSRPNRAIFENVFGFSLEGLAQGAKALAHDDVHAAIFGGGLGGTVQPDRILKTLETEREALFKEKGSAQPIAQVLKRVEELAKEVTRASTRVEEWNKREGDLTVKESAAEAHARALAEKQTELARLRAIEQAIPVARERAAASAELAQLRGRSEPGVSAQLEGRSSELPPDAAARHARLIEERATIEAELVAERAREQEARRALEERVVDAEALAREAEIEALAAHLSRREAAALERPRRQAELAELARASADMLADLRPEWSLEDLRRARFHAAATAELHDAIAAREELAAREASHARALAESRAELRRAEAQLSALPAAIDPAPLRAWLDARSGHLAELAELEELVARIATRARKQSALRKKLSPPLAEEGDAAAVHGPRLEEIAPLDRQLAELTAARARTEQAIAARAGDLAEITRLLADVDASARVPNDADLLGLRSKRDASFDAVLCAANAARAELPSLAVAHERARAAADDAVDRMRLHADAVQLRAVRESHRAQFTAELGELRARLAVEHAEVERWQAAWKSRFIGIEPAAPAAMRAWLVDRDAWLAEAVEIEELRARKELLARSTARFRARAIELGGEPESAHAAFEARVASEEQRAHAQRVLEERIAREAARVQRLEAESLQAERESLALRWVRAVEPFGLPADITAPGARAVVQGLVELRATLITSEQHLREAVAATDREIESFDARVHRLEPACEDPVTAARAWVSRLGSARKTAAERREAERMKSDSERRIAEKTASLATREAALTALHEQAGADETSFAEVARVHARMQELEREVAARDRLLAGLDLEELATANLARAEPLAAEVSVLVDESRRLHQEVGSARALLRAIDGRSEAAEARAQLEAERATLRVQAERWSILALAEKLLRDAISKFERENQPELLERASSLFAEMTLGRHLRVRRHLDKNLWVERADGVEVLPEQLSTGTREQLFLAIRLAYVDQYRKGAEVLPVVLDDVLVNFDAARAGATLGALARFGRDVQVLLFTCHEHMVDLARDAGAEILSIPLAGSVASEARRNPEVH